MKGSRIFALGVLLASSTTAEVFAELTVIPETSSLAYYDDNPRMRVNPPTSVVATVNNVELGVLYEQPTYNISLTPRFRLSRYTEETELDSEDYFVDLSVLKNYERHQYSGEFNYEREASYITEQTDSSIFNVNVPRTTFSLNGSWSYSYSEKVRYTVFGNALDVSFEEDPRSTFIDYEQFGIGTSLSYALSDRTILLSTFSISEFKTPQTGTETLSYAYQFGFENQLYESVRSSFSIGQNISHIDFKSLQTELISISPPRIRSRIVTRSERTAGPITNLEINKEFEHANVWFKWARAFSPSSEGARQQTQEVEGFGRYRFTQFFHSEIWVKYRERTQEGDLGVRQLIGDLKTITVRGKLLYRLSQSMRAELGFRYREQKRTDRGVKSDAIRVFLAVRFTPEGIRYSN